MLDWTIASCHLSNEHRQFAHAHLVRIAYVDRIRLFRLQQPIESINLVRYVTETSSLRSISVYGNRFTDQSLHNEIRHHTTIPRAHPLSIRIEYSGDPRVHPVDPVIPHRHRFPEPFRLVITRALSYRIHVAPISLVLRVNLRVTIYLRARGEQEPRPFLFGKSQSLMRPERTDLQRLNRFLEVVHRAELERAHGLADPGVGGDEEERDLAVRRADLAEQCDQARTILDDPQADEELKKLAEAEIEQLSRQLDEARAERSELFHQVVRMEQENTVLRKTASLSDPEYDLVRRHPVTGERIVNAVSSLHSLRDAIRHHHERVDGKGYPDGLKGDEIDTKALILGAADALDAMLYDRPYRHAYSSGKAREEISKGAGTQFHTEVAQTLLRLLDRGDLPIEEGEAASETPRVEAQASSD